MGFLFPHIRSGCRCMSVEMWSLSKQISITIDLSHDRSHKVKQISTQISVGDCQLQLRLNMFSNIGKNFLLRCIWCHILKQISKTDFYYDRSQSSSSLRICLVQNVNSKAFHTSRLSSHHIHSNSPGMVMSNIACRVLKTLTPSLKWFKLSL